MYLTHHYLIDLVAGGCLATFCFYFLMPEELKEWESGGVGRLEEYDLVDRTFFSLSFLRLEGANGVRMKTDPPPALHCPALACTPQRPFAQQTQGTCPTRSPPTRTTSTTPSTPRSGNSKRAALLPVLRQPARGRTTGQARPCRPLTNTQRRSAHRRQVFNLRRCRWVVGWDRRAHPFRGLVRGMRGGRRRTFDRLKNLRDGGLQLSHPPLPLPLFLFCDCF